MRKVLIAIPVYNAPTHLQNLLDDLLRVYSHAKEALHFVFCDDASPDPKIQLLLSSHPFMSLSNVSQVRRASNLGFLKNVNEVSRLRDPDTDLLILNTDVRFRSDFIALMAKHFDEVPNIASITPLSTNATLASLLNWPVGGALSESYFERMDAALTDEVISIDVPTGVGFCMYLSREALNEIGIFDEVFGAGYGEETDWCLRAKKAGYRNILALNAFVPHVGTQSFTVERKLAQQKKAEKIIRKLHPDYDLHVSNHYYENSWRLYRLRILTSAFSNFAKNERPLVQLLHSDPESKNAGGTEGQVRRASISRSLGGIPVFEIFPRAGKWACNLFVDGESISHEEFQFLDFPNLLSIFEAAQCELHIHHFLNWPSTAIEHILEFKGKIAITIHDFWFITPAVNLYAEELRGDGLEKARRSTAKYRAISEKILSRADVIFTPSKEMKYWLETFFTDRLFLGRVEVRNHDLSYLFSLEDSAEQSLKIESKRSIVFVGALHPHKGAEEIAKAIPLLKNAGFEVLIFGKVASRGLKRANVTVYPYKNASELKQLLGTHRPSIAYFNSITPESFCFSFYEALILSNYTVPAVSPLGNPEREVRENNIGIVAKGFSAADILNASNSAIAEHARLLKNVNQWKLALQKRNEFPLEIVKSRLRENSVSPIPDRKLLQFSAGEYKSAAVYNLAMKTKIAFKLLDKVVAKFPFFEGAIRSFLGLAVFLKSWVARN